MSRDADRGSRGGAGAPAGAGPDRAGAPEIELPDSWDLPRAVQEPPRVDAAAAVAPHHRRPPYLFLVVGIAAVMLATVAAAAIAWQLTDTAAPSTKPEAVAAAPVLSSPQPASSTAVQPPPATSTRAALAPTASGSAAASAAASSSASSSPSAVRYDSPGACFASLLPEGALGEPIPKLEACCTGEDGYDTMLKLKSALVRVGGGAVTPAMSEWSILGWHETAAFAIMRAHCCPDAPALRLNESLSKCRTDEALAYLVNALDDKRKMTEALEAYRAAAKCLAGSGWGGSFNQYGFPHDGELASVKRIVERIAKARGR